jgi:hypothetical protein
MFRIWPTVRKHRKNLLLETSTTIQFRKSIGRISFNCVGNAPRLAAKRGPMGTRLNEGTSALVRMFCGTNSVRHDERPE